MKNRHVKPVYMCFSLVCLWFVSSYSFANAATACRDVDKVTENVNDSTCFQYVQGFLEGALLSDTQIIANLGTSPEMSSFAERAMRTRLGQRRGELPATYLANFCLPEDVVSDAVVYKIIDVLKQVEDKQTISAERIYAIVKNEFPC